MNINMLQDNKILASCHCVLCSDCLTRRVEDFQWVYLMVIHKQLSVLLVWVLFYLFDMTVLFSGWCLHTSAHILAPLSVGRLQGNAGGFSSKLYLYFSLITHNFSTLHISLSPSLSLCTLLWRLFFQRLDMWWDLDLIDFHSLHVWSCSQLKSVWLEEVVFFSSSDPDTNNPKTLFNSVCFFF